MRLDAAMSQAELLNWLEAEVSKALGPEAGVDLQNDMETLSEALARVAETVGWPGMDEVAP